MSRKKVKNQKPDARLPIIQFVGKRRVINKKTGKIGLVQRDAPQLIINGAKTIKLPSSDVQRAGFTHEDAAFLLSAYPKDFKRKTVKGAKN